MQQLYNSGYSSTDIIQTLFRVVRNTEMAEYLKLEYIKVPPCFPLLAPSHARKLLSTLTPTSTHQRCMYIVWLARSE